MKSQIVVIVGVATIALSSSGYSSRLKCIDEAGNVTLTDKTYPLLSVISNCAINNRQSGDSDKYQCALSSGGEAWSSEDNANGRALLCRIVGDQEQVSSAPRESVAIRLIDDDPVENSAIWADCSQVGPTMTCDFTQILIDGEPDKGELRRRVNEKIHQLLAHNPTEKSDFCKVVAYASSGGFAAKLAEKKDDPLAGYIKDEMAAVAKAGTPYCVNATKEASLVLAKFMVRSEADTCHLNVRNYREIFSHQSGNVWTHNTGPNGQCGIVEITTLTETSPYAWVYKINRVITNRAGDKSSGDNSACDKLKEGVRTYSWNGTPKFRNCRSLKFDFLL